jgi:SAM-dependent methyltransferase
MTKHYTDGSYWANRKGFRSEYKVPLILAAIEQAGVKLDDTTRILEVGCGNGAFLWPFSEVLARSGIRPRLEGIDIAANAITEAQQLAGENPPMFACTTLDSHESSYDIALLIDVVEHVPCPVDFLVSVRRVAPLIFLHLPIGHSFLHLVAGRPTASYHAYRHIHFFSLETARLLIEDAGWRIRHVRHSAADTATVRLPATKLLRIGRFARYLAYRAMPLFTALAAGGSVTFVCDRPE